MVSRAGDIGIAAPETFPMVERESLCPAFGYSHSSTTMKVMKFAEYIPIIGMVVGAVHLAWSVKKWSEGASGAGSHILRALVALTNVGFVLAFKDLMEEISLTSDGAERPRPSQVEREGFSQLQEKNQLLNRCLEALKEAEAQPPTEEIPYLQGRIRVHAKAILDLALEIHHPDAPQEMERIIANAKDALQRLGERKS